MTTLIFGMVLPWLLIAVGTWLGYQLVAPERPHPAAAGGD